MERRNLDRYQFAYLLVLIVTAFRTTFPIPTAEAKSVRGNSESTSSYVNPGGTLEESRSRSDYQDEYYDDGHDGHHAGSSADTDNTEEDDPVISCSERNQPVYEGNPQDCTSYFVCSGLYYALFHCPGDLHFNPRSFQCDWKDNVGCVEIIAPVNKTDDSKLNSRQFRLIKSS